MTNGKLDVQILSPAKVVAKAAAQQVQVPGTLGYMGILPGHTRLVSELGVGELTVQEGEGREGGQLYFIAGGYVDVAEDHVTVLVDVIEKPGDIDVQRAEKAKERALDRLQNIGAKVEIDLLRCQAALARAEGRLAVAQKARG